MLEGLGPGSESSRLLKGMDPGEVLIRVRLASAFVRFATGRPESVRCRTPQTREYARRTLGEFLPGVTVERVQPQTLGPQGTGGFVFLGFALRSKPIGSAFRGLAEILTGIPPGGVTPEGPGLGAMISEISAEPCPLKCREGLPRIFRPMDESTITPDRLRFPVRRRRHAGLR